MWVAIGILTTMGVVLGGLLGVAARFLHVKEDPLEEELKALLPGSQCGQCGYVGCSQYAAALAKGEAPVTLCPPGGKDVIESLAKKLGVSVDLSEHQEAVPQHAFVIEDLCIGCTRCIRECTTDSIMGANKLMHTIIVETCHGCAKCVPVCPTEAIVMVQIPVTLSNWHWPKPEIQNKPVPQPAHAH